MFFETWVLYFYLRLPCLPFLTAKEAALEVPMFVCPSEFYLLEKSTFNFFEVIICSSSQEQRSACSKLLPLYFLNNKTVSSHILPYNNNLSIENSTICLLF